MREVYEKEEKENGPMSAEEQLEYVIPKEGREVQFEWHYKRYMWESELQELQEPCGFLVRSSAKKCPH